jgi:hypothetical protein
VIGDWLHWPYTFMHPPVLALFMDFLTVEDAIGMLSQNIAHRSPSDIVPHLRRMETPWINRIFTVQLLRKP